MMQVEDAVRIQLRLLLEDARDAACKDPKVVVPLRTSPEREHEFADNLRWQLPIEKMKGHFDVAESQARIEDRLDLWHARSALLRFVFLAVVVVGGTALANSLDESLGQVWFSGFLLSVWVGLFAVIVRISSTDEVQSAADRSTSTLDQQAVHASPRSRKGRTRKVVEIVGIAAGSVFGFVVIFGPAAWIVSYSQVLGGASGAADLGRVLLCVVALSVCLCTFRPSKEYEQVPPLLRGFRGFALEIVRSTQRRKASSWHESAWGWVAASIGAVSSASVCLLRSLVRDGWLRGEFRLFAVKDATKAAGDAMLLPVIDVLNETIGEEESIEFEAYAYTDSDDDGYKTDRDLWRYRSWSKPLGKVDTRNADRLARLISHMEGGSIGLFGPRGVGKSTLLTSVARRNDLQIDMPASPNMRAVDFLAALLVGVTSEVEASIVAERETGVAKSAKEFKRRRRSQIKKGRRAVAIALHVAVFGLQVALVGVAVWAIGISVDQRFDTNLVNSSWSFLGSIDGSVSSAASAVVDGDHVKKVFPVHAWVIAVPIAFALLYVSLWRFNIGIWELGSDRSDAKLLRSRSRALRARLLAERSSTSGRSLGFSLRGLGLGANNSESLRDREINLASLTSDARSYLADLSSFLKSREGRLLICIDELDRMETSDEIAAFLNDLKGIFAIRNCFFLMTIASGAGVSHELRGEQGAGAIDSAFDEILELDVMTRDEAGELLARMALGFTPPFISLCYVLAGGLPREIQRVGREMLDVNDAWREQWGDWASLAHLSRTISATRIQRSLDKSRQIMLSLVEDANSRRVRSAIADLSQTQLRFGSEAVSDDQFCELESKLEQLENLDTSMNFTSACRSLRCRNYLLLTVRELFTDQSRTPGVALLSRAEMSDSMVEKLASAMREMARFPEHSWQLISECRADVGLSPWLQRLDLVDGNTPIATAMNLTAD
jgi:hypothetical protein